MEPEKWPKSVPHSLDSRLRATVDDPTHGTKAPLLPPAEGPQRRVQQCRTASDYVNTLPVDVRNSLVKHSRLVDRQFKMDSKANDAVQYYRRHGFEPRQDPEPRGQYDMLDPWGGGTAIAKVPIIQEPSCWSCQPNLSDEEYVMLRGAVLKHKLAAAGHPLPPPQLAVLPPPFNVQASQEAHNDQRPFGPIPLHAMQQQAQLAQQQTLLMQHPAYYSQQHQQQRQQQQQWEQEQALQGCSSCFPCCRPRKVHQEPAGPPLPMPHQPDTGPASAVAVEPQQVQQQVWAQQQQQQQPQAFMEPPVPVQHQQHGSPPTAGAHGQLQQQALNSQQPQSQQSSYPGAAGGVPQQQRSHGSPGPAPQPGPALQQPGSVPQQPTGAPGGGGILRLPPLQQPMGQQQPGIGIAPALYDPSAFAAPALSAQQEQQQQQQGPVHDQRVGGLQQQGPGTSVGQGQGYAGSGPGLQGGQMGQPSAAGTDPNAMQSGYPGGVQAGQVGPSGAFNSGLLSQQQMGVAPPVSPSAQMLSPSQGQQPQPEQQPAKGGLLSRFGFGKQQALLQEQPQVQQEMDPQLQQQQQPSPQAKGGLLSRFGFGKQQQLPQEQPPLQPPGQQPPGQQQPGQQLPGQQPPGQPQVQQQQPVQPAEVTQQQQQQQPSTLKKLFGLGRKDEQAQPSAGPLPPQVEQQAAAPASLQQETPLAMQAPQANDPATPLPPQQQFSSAAPQAASTSQSAPVAGASSSQHAPAAASPPPAEGAFPPPRSRMNEIEDDDDIDNAEDVSALEPPKHKLHSQSDAIGAR